MSPDWRLDTLRDGTRAPCTLHIASTKRQAANEKSRESGGEDNKSQGFRMERSLVDLSLSLSCRCLSLPCLALGVRPTPSHALRRIKPAARARPRARSMSFAVRVGSSILPGKTKGDGYQVLTRAPPTPPGVASACQCFRASLFLLRTERRWKTTRQGGKEKVETRAVDQRGGPCRLCCDWTDRDLGEGGRVAIRREENPKVFPAFSEVDLAPVQLGRALQALLAGTLTRSHAALPQI